MTASEGVLCSEYFFTYNLQFQNTELILEKTNAHRPVHSGERPCYVVFLFVLFRNLRHRIDLILVFGRTVDPFASEAGKSTAGYHGNGAEPKVEKRFVLQREQRERNFHGRGTASIQVEGEQQPGVRY